jgi:aspartyl-tRNA(Asn)/glutamyl-tRNA(Gln) amidotransferase subunit C
MLTHEELLKIAALAKLSLEGEELDALAADIGGVIEFANHVSEADLSGYDLSERDENYPLREDAVLPSLPAELILSNAGKTAGGFFVSGGRGGVK